MGGATFLLWGGIEDERVCIGDRGWIFQVSGGVSLWHNGRSRTNEGGRGGVITGVVVIVGEGSRSFAG